MLFSPLLPKEQVQTLKAIVQRHHGMVVGRADQATHEIIPDAGQEEEEGDYCRTIDEQVCASPGRMRAPLQLHHACMETCATWPCHKLRVGRGVASLVSVPAA